MKTFELKQGDKDLLKVICEQSPEGVTIADVRRAIKLIDAIDAADNVLSLEDADHLYLRVKFEGMKFVKADRGILDLFDRIATAQPAQK
jgi:hypothetical protein